MPGPEVSGATSRERYSFGQRQQVVLRHIKRGTAASPGAKALLGVYFYPETKGLNGKLGFQNGQYEKKVNEEGSFSLTFTNGTGEDGTLHRERFAAVTDDDYRPGEEYIEIWLNRELVFVGVPVSYELSFTTLTIKGFSPFWLLKKTRETAAGYWATAPRDVLENYLSVWQEVLGKEFEGWNYAFNAAELTTSDGWKYQRVEPGPSQNGAKLITIGGISTLTSPTFSLPFGSASAEPHLSWRVEINAYVKGLVRETNNNILTLYLLGAFGGKSYATFAVEPNLIYTAGAEFYNSETIGSQPLADGEHHFAIEARDRWFYFYMDGKLVSVLGGEVGPWEGGRVNIGASQGVGNATQLEVIVHSVLVRHQRPFLFNAQKPGDYNLPGLPPPGGLEGHYHMDQDIYSFPSSYSPAKSAKKLHPIREIDPASGESGGLYQRRLDQVIDFPSGSGWMPPGPPEGNEFSCRWVGAIYLDLTNYDFAMRATIDNGCRIWVGKTRLGEYYLDRGWEEPGVVETYTAPWIKAGSSAGSPPSGTSGVLAGQKSGWYPIIIEYWNKGAPGALTVEYQRSDGIGAWQKLGLPKNASDGGNYSAPESALVKLSPLGVYQDNVQFDSHYDAFQRVAETYGYQWVETPQSLESGLFPGYVEPKTKVGRNTEYVLEASEATDAAVQGNADDVADSILAEAQGIGDPTQAAQLTMEVYELPTPGLFFMQESESLSDINLEALAVQRVKSLLALHLSPWEEVGARPKGTRKLLDSFPLTGVLSEFKWEPGDGIRLRFPPLRVEDQNPRQILGINWPLTPDGVGAPSASFKQRPRNLLLSFRKMLRDAVSARRNYQGQLVKVQGQLGGNSGEQDVDAYSRCSLPVNMSDIAKAVFVVHVKGDTSEWEIEVNGVATGRRFTRAGRYDITPWVARQAATSRCYARGIGGTSYISGQVELLIRV